MSGELYLSVEIAAGTSEGAAARAIIRLADRLGIIVVAKHNGDEMRAAPGDSAEEVIRTFDRERNYPKS